MYNLIFNVRLKTGYFKTELYEMVIDKNHISLKPKDDGIKLMTINLHDLVAVSITGKIHPEIEIQTTKNTYYGIMDEYTDMDELLIMFRRYAVADSGVTIETFV